MISNRFCPVCLVNPQPSGGIVCSDCEGIDPYPFATARVGALNSGASFFKFTCETHGLTEYRTSTSKCVACSRHRGDDPLRAEARRTRSPSFLKTCEKHGFVKHSTIRGKCLDCFTTLGQPRTVPAQGFCQRGHGLTRIWPSGDCVQCFTSTGKGKVPKPHGTKAERRKGPVLDYLDDCDMHGEALFNADNSLCTRCFTVAWTPIPNS